MSKLYENTYKESISNKENFWAQAANDVCWIKKFDQTLFVDKQPFYKWFKGGKINTCYNALDRHVDEGNGNRTALIFDSAMTNTKKKFLIKN